MQVKLAYHFPDAAGVIFVDVPDEYDGAEGLVVFCEVDEFLELLARAACAWRFSLDFMAWYCTR